VTGWIFAWDGFDPAGERHREALATLGNGYLGSRGAVAWASAGEQHYPGTYAAGLYNRLVSEVAGREVPHEDLVNLPNWLPLTFRSGDGAWLDAASCRVHAWRQELDLAAAELRRHAVVESADGQRVRLVERRLVSMADPHLLAIELVLTPLGWSGPVMIRGALDGMVRNAGVARYAELRQRHLMPGATGRDGEDRVWLRVETIQSAVRVALAQRLRVADAQAGAVAEREGWIGQDVAVEARDGVPIRIEKVVALHTSRDWAITEPTEAARLRVAAAGDYAALRAAHAEAWAALWEEFGIELEDHADQLTERTLQILRLHIFHLLATASPHSLELDAGVPARGWSGEAYRGHVFWDELFIFPTLNWRMPEITRALLLYRWRRLDAARRLAAAAGLEGAMFPWQSSADGSETSQTWHLNPKSGRWLPDHTHLQRHVNLAIAWNIWQYWEATADLDFMRYYGAEMLLEIARLMASLARHDPGDDRYGILGVMGPDEYHDAYPGAPEPGLDDNTYTNVMTSWLLARIAELPSLLGEDAWRRLARRLRVDAAELARLDTIGRRLRIVFHADGIPSQFRGYEELQEFDWDGYRARYGDIQRLDRILEAEGKSANDYKVSKQADVLMLFYLFSAEELARLFERLGYAFPGELIGRTIDYYIARSSDGSTLSRVVHAWVLARRDRAHSFRLFQAALESDVADIQGGTTAEGIHLGAMAGTVDIVQRCWTGLATKDGVLRIDPALPEGVGRLALRLHYRGHTLGLEVRADEVELRMVRCAAPEITVAHGSQRHPCRSGAVLRLRIPAPA
jgi:trehalose/maltose hydrolase-like predicted phosphorylase